MFLYLYLSIGISVFRVTHYLLEAAVWTESDAKLQIFVDFDAEFDRNMLQEVANWQFFCRRCQNVVEI